MNGAQSEELGRDERDDVDSKSDEGSSVRVGMRSFLDEEFRVSVSGKLVSKELGRWQQTDLR